MIMKRDLTIFRFVSISSIEEPTELGEDDNIFITRSLDPTSHVETIVEDVRDVSNEETGCFFSEFTPIEDVASGYKGKGPCTESSCPRRGCASARVKFAKRMVDLLGLDVFVYVCVFTIPTMIAIRSCSPWLVASDRFLY